VRAPCLITSPIRILQSQTEPLTRRSTCRELEQIFVAATAFEGKDLKILGWGGVEDARALIRASLVDPDAHGG